MGVKRGDRVATLAMNHHRHLVAWYGAIGMGGVIHTINPRLFDEQLVYIANHAEDKVLFYDKAFQPIVDRLKDAMDDDRALCLLRRRRVRGADRAPRTAIIAWVEGSEREPCMLCYTSGTTGNPKGVLYEHRSSVIHAMAEVAPACFDLSPEHGRAADRADVPRRRLGPALRRRDGGDQVGLFRGQRSGRAVPADERGEGDPQRRRADRLARHVPAYGRDRRDARASHDSSPSAARRRRGR